MPAALGSIKRLTAGSPPDNWYTSKVSLTKILSSLYPKAGASQVELRGIFAELAKEETPMVRRAACANLAEFCGVLENKIIIEEMIPIFKAVCKFFYLPFLLIKSFLTLIKACR